MVMYSRVAVGLNGEFFVLFWKGEMLSWMNLGIPKWLMME